MFSRFDIKALNLNAVPVENVYGGYQELYYLVDYVKQLTGVEIGSTFEYRNCKYDTIPLKNSDRFDFLVGGNNRISFATVYVKTIIDTDDTDYYRVYEDIEKKKYRFYYSPSSNNLIVFINKGVEWIENGIMRHFLLLRMMINCLLNEEQQRALCNDPGYQAFYNAFDAGQKTTMANWLKEHYPRVINAMNIKEQLKEFFKKGNERELHDAEDSVRVYMRDLETYIDYYNNSYKKLTEARRRVEILQMSAGENPELLEAFENIQNVKLIDVNLQDQELVFTVETNLTQYDPEKTTALINTDYNYASWKTAGKIGTFSVDDRKKILKLLFAEDPRFVIRVKQRFYIDPTNNIYAVRGAVDEEGYIKNPHLDKFNCFGANGQYINQAFHEHDYTQGFILLTACVANINLMEDMTMKHLWAELFGDKCEDKFIIDTETGELVSIMDLRNFIIEGEMPKVIKDVLKEDETWNTIDTGTTPDHFTVNNIRPANADDYMDFEELTAGTTEDTRARIEALRGRRAQAVEVAEAETTEEDVLDAVRRMNERAAANDIINTITTDETADDAVLDIAGTITTTATADEVEEAVNNWMNDAAETAERLHEVIGNNLPEHINEALDLIEEEPEEEFIPTFNQAERNEARVNR